MEVGRSRANILGIPVDCCTRIEFRMFLRRALAGLRARRIVTLNPEIALAAWRDPRYGVAIRTADLCTVDGVGVALALRFLGYGGPGRITGGDVLDDLAAFGQEEGKTVAFLLRHDGLTAPPLLRQALVARWPSLRTTVGVIDPHEPMNPALASAIADAAPDILIVNFGHQDQEGWLAENLDRFPSVRIAVGIGGALDYFSGVVPRPPVFLRRFGLEWTWRLVRQPRRIRRIFRAVVVFPCAVMRDVLHQRIASIGRHLSVRGY